MFTRSIFLPGTNSAAGLRSVPIRSLVDGLIDSPTDGAAGHAAEPSVGDQLRENEAQLRAAAGNVKEGA